jgi:HEAT repeat protein
MLAEADRRRGRQPGDEALQHGLAIEQRCLGKIESLGVEQIEQDVAKPVLAAGAQVGLQFVEAGKTAGILDDEMVSGRTRGSGNAAEQAKTLCNYLCRALGEFAVPEAAVPLVKRAGDANDPQTAQAAVEALAVLSANLAAAGKSFDDPAAVAAAVLKASTSDLESLRSSAAYTLGVLGGSPAIERLRLLVEDAGDDVRYNASLGLARQGRAEAVDGLCEMLALEDLPLTAAADPVAQSQRYKRALVVVNALRGVALLVDATHEPPPKTLLERVQATGDDPVADVRSSAAALLKKIERLSATP